MSHFLRRDNSRKTKQKSKVKLQPKFGLQITPPLFFSFSACQWFSTLFNNWKQSELGNLLTIIKKSWYWFYFCKGINEYSFLWIEFLKSCQSMHVLVHKSWWLQPFIQYSCYLKKSVFKTSQWCCKICVPLHNLNFTFKLAR